MSTVKIMSSYIHQVCSSHHILDNLQRTPLAKSEFYLTIRLRARVFYEQIVNEAQLSLVENSGE